jgi:predicted ATPase
LETLQLQVEEWMNQWIAGLQLKARKYEDASMAEMRFSKKGFKSDWKKPANIGFGVSYSLPLVVAGLLAPKGSILIIDTPEAHLHPAGQSAIGGFLARLAAGGVQVIVETHSDHIINGLRLAVANPDHPIKADEILINNFDKTETGPSVKKIGLDRFGGLTSWPAGFLDQIEQDLAKLARIDSELKPSNS